MSERKTSSLRNRLLVMMLLASLIPILLVDVLMYTSYIDILQSNTKELTQANLKQTRTALDTWIDSYGDIMYQVYSNEDINNHLNQYYENGKDEATESYLNIKLRTLLYTKDYIMAITIVTSEGDTFFYDRITPFSSHTFWSNHYSLSMPEIYDLVVDSADTMYFSTEYAKTIPSKKYYLFHMAHSTTYTVGNDMEKAVVIVSIDEQLLENICNSDEDDNRDSMTFVVDSNGYIVSYSDSAYLSEQITVDGLSDEQKKEKYLEFVKDSGIMGQNNLAVEILHDDKLNWDIINVSSTHAYDSEIASIQKQVVMVTIVAGIIVIIIIIFTIKYLLQYINVIVDKMHLVKNGITNVRIDTTDKMPVEVATIAEHFNKMLDQLELSMENEKLLAERERVAEIAALEAQINPHFLYNTLDTINWMAIDNDEIEISNAISALGKILRYGINDSNGIVSIATEMDWLGQYIFLQQTRLKDEFKYDINVEPEAMDCKIHKLLIQPFVENSIIHGFTGKAGIHELEIRIEVKDGLRISIRDNGVGMTAEQVEKINSRNFKQYDDKYHVGMENAFQRIKMYYGDKSDVYVDSVYGEGTTVYIVLPRDGESI